MLADALEPEGLRDLRSALLRNANSVVLSDGNEKLSGQELLTRAEMLADSLRILGVRRVALSADNGSAWIVCDLACLMAGLCLLPLPQFFSTAQLRHCIRDAGIEVIITDAVQATLARIDELGTWLDLGVNGLNAAFLPSPTEALLPPATAKITFTSGSTGAPKGACLSAAQQFKVSSALVGATALEAPRHLCLLPLPTLLENIAGVYAPLLAGGEIIAPPLAEVGLTGSSKLNLGKMLAALEQWQPNSVILLPQLLIALVTACELGWRVPQSSMFMAVGGAKVSPVLLKRARDLGLPVFEGYGLSECASVVSLNMPEHDRPGSTGKVLPHLSVRIEEGEIVVSGNAFLGYAGDENTWHQGDVRTGDLGYVDDDGFLHVNGRRKSMLITSYGRNINPEWVEAELLGGPLLSQCVVVGDSKPFCAALLYPRDPETRPAVIQAWIEKVNAGLPDYARVVTWRQLPESLSSSEGMLTENGRLRRDMICTRYAEQIESLYSQHGNASC